MKDLFEIYTRYGGGDDYVFRMCSLSKEYLHVKGHEWKRLGFITDFEVRPKSI